MKFLEKHSKYSVFVLRIVLGIIFIANGWKKVNGIDGVIGFFAGLGFPAFLAYFVAYVELLGGLAILLGLYTRYASALIAIIMLVAIFKVKIGGSFLGGWDIDLALLGIAVSLMLSGAGECSLDKKYHLG